MNLSPGEAGTWEELPAGPVFKEDGPSSVREVCPIAPSMECGTRRLPQWEGQGLSGDIGGTAPLLERSEQFSWNTSFTYSHCKFGENRFVCLFCLFCSLLYARIHTVPHIE